MSDSPRNQRQPAGLIFCAFFTFAAIVYAGTYSGGSGTAEDPYKISTVADWQELIAASADWDQHFILLNDIDFGGIHLTPVAPDTDVNEWEFRGTPFSGSLDGYGHLLMNLKIDGSGNKFIGLFGCVGAEGQIRNLGVKNVMMVGMFFIGGLVGNNYGTVDSCFAGDGVSVSCEMYMAGGLVGGNQGLIHSCYSTSTISSSGDYIGGLVGWNETGTMTACSATGTINSTGSFVGGLAGGNGGTIADCYASVDVSNPLNSVGGLVGSNGGTILTSYAAGTVTGSADIGGLVGFNSGKITACYATGEVRGAASESGVGGLVGYIWGGTIDACYATGAVGGNFGGGLLGMRDMGSVTGCFWDMETSGKKSSSGGQGMTTVQMKILSYYKFAGWAGKGWVMQNGVDYPRLSWENTAGIPIPPAGYSSGGCGTPEDPYQIFTISDWQDLIADTAEWNKQYILMSDINFGGILLFPIAPATNTVPWGFQGIPFTGTLEGNGHILSNLIIDGANTDYIGVFGYLGSGGQIRNLDLKSITITGNKCIGGAVGINRDGTVTSCSISGSVSGKSGVGGLVGSNNGTITTCDSACTVSGNEGIGGLAGENNEKSISDCFSTGTVSGNSSVGGLVGSNNHGTITACYTAGTLVAPEKAGGMTGLNSGTIADCYASCVISSSYSFLGGVGGICGNNSGTISGCSESGIISSTGRYVGGLVGSNSGGTITNCTPTGSVKGANHVGGVVGWNEGSITHCSSKSVVSGVYDYPSYIGGLVGTNQGGTVTDSNTAGSVSGYKDVGGLIGFNSGTITACYAIGPVSGSLYVGGLTGYNDKGEIVACYASGPVNGGKGQAFGGLVGWNTGSITACYATGPVRGSLYVGGLVGQNSYGTIMACYAIGTIDRSSDTGGLVAWNSSGTIMACFWDRQTTGQTRSGGGRGLTTEQMQTMSVYQNTGWGDQGWVIQDGVGYPRLSWENTEGSPIPSAVIPFAGKGTAEDPYRISTEEEFALLSWYPSILDKHIQLIADVDLSGIPLYPIGEYDGCPFTGIFDGNGHTISNGGISLSENLGVGFFGRVGPGGQIRNLDLENVDVAGFQVVGGLVGWNEGTITACSVTGDIEGYDHRIGGLIGSNGGSITACSMDGVVRADDYYSSSTGGLVGGNSGPITDCYATGMVSGHSYVGGLAGWNSGTLMGNHTSNTVDGSGNWIGGLVAVNSLASITACHATGTVSSGGGLVGENDRGTITACYATGDVGSGGGLVGRNFEGVITACYATGRIGGNGGGLVSVNDGGQIMNCYATGIVGGFGGGLVAWNGEGMITACYSTGFCGSGGALVEHNDRGTVTASFWDLQITGQGAGSGGTGKTTAEMKAISTFTGAGWDFVGEAANGTVDVWRMCGDGIDYPRLSWEFSQGGDMDCPDGVALEDLLYLAGRWMAGTPSGVGAADANGDGKADLQDFGVMAEEWGRE